MIKRLYLANGTLQSPLSKTAEDISVDAGLANYMLSQLGIYDWAYLTIQWGEITEVVKVYLDYSGLNVYRGQDGTCRQAFPAGATVRYGLTQAEIQDATPIAAVNLYANGANPLTVSEANGAWVITYAPVNAACEGGIQAYFSLYDATLHLADYYPAAGCSSIAGNGAPLIGGPYFYLTSRPYTVEGSDWMTPNPNRHKPNKHDFGFGDLWLLTQPFVTDEYMRSHVNVGYMYVFGSQGSFTVIDGSIQGKGVHIVNVNVYGSEGSFTVRDTSMMKGGCYILQGLLYGSEISYTYGHESYIRSHMAINSATVS